VAVGFYIQDFASRLRAAVYKVVDQLGLGVVDVSANNAFATLVRLVPQSATQEMRTATVGSDYYHLRGPASADPASGVWEGVKFVGGANGATPSRVQYLPTGVVASAPNTAAWPL